MANEKQYLEVFNDGQDDLYIRDQEAQEELSQIPTIYATKTALTQATIIPVNLEEMTPTSTFIQNSILFINGVGYRAKQDTTHFPVVLLVEDGHFVADYEDGAPAFVVEDYTLDEDWEIWGDASLIRTLKAMRDELDETIAQMEAQQTAFIQQATQVVLGSVKLNQLVSNTAGTKQYTVGELFMAMADLMDKRVVADDIED